MNKDGILNTTWVARPHYRRKDLWMVCCGCCGDVRIVDLRPGKGPGKKTAPGFTQSQAKRLAEYLNKKSSIKQKSAEMTHTRDAVVRTVRRYALKNKIPMRDAFGMVYEELNSRIGGTLCRGRKDGQKTLDIIAEKGLLGKALEIANNMDFRPEEDRPPVKKDLFQEKEEHLDPETGEITERFIRKTRRK